MVVAEGAEEGLINSNERITKVEKRDGSGNLIYDDIGENLKTMIRDYAANNHKFELNVAYFDPTYAIRSVAANSGDVFLCTKLS